jgi:hypothetical protein
MEHIPIKYFEVQRFQNDIAGWVKKIYTERKKRRITGLFTTFGRHEAWEWRSHDLAEWRPSRRRRRIVNSPVMRRFAFFLFFCFQSYSLIALFISSIDNFNTFDISSIDHQIFLIS